MKLVLLFLAMISINNASLNWEVEALDPVTRETTQIPDKEWITRCVYQSKMAKFLSREAGIPNVLHLEVHCLQEIEGNDPNTTHFQMDGFWRDINFFGKFNSLEKKAVVAITTNEVGEPTGWKIIHTGTLIHKGHFPIENLPMPPRKKGDSWVTLSFGA